MKNILRHFKVVYGFGQDNFIPIDETELEKAMYAFMSGKKIVLTHGAIDGSQISKVIPDYHKTLGWNYGHKLGTEDWEEVNQKCGNFEGLITHASEKVKHLIEAGKENLIGTEPLPQLLKTASKEMVHISKHLK
jgi:hypothetical protein